jgi:hypothetical protein
MEVTTQYHDHNGKKHPVHDITDKVQYFVDLARADKFKEIELDFFLESDEEADDSKEWVALVAYYRHTIAEISKVFGNPVYDGYGPSRHGYKEMTPGFAIDNHAGDIAWWKTPDYIVICKLTLHDANTLREVELEVVEL